VGIIARGDAGKGAADDLLPLLEDPSKSIRLTAAEALCKIGHGKKALPVLIKALGHENKLVRKYAAETIVLIGEFARPVLGEIKKSLKENTPFFHGIVETDYIRRSLETAIMRLEGKYSL